MTSTDRPSPADPLRRHPAEEMHNEDVAHEHSDIDIRTVLTFGAGLVVVVLICAALVRGLFGVFERRAAANDPQLSPFALPAGQRPPDPMLQTNEPAGLAKFRMDQEKTLQSYGWVDQIGGVTHIPIAEAKKLTVDRGLPIRAGAADDGRLGTHAYAMGESSGGRTLTTPARPAAAPDAAAPAPATPPAHAEPGKH
jgi:hypothetical protein